MTALAASWWGVAACRESDPELFFPISATPALAVDVARAKAICASCPVRLPCLRYALDNRQEQGIWGGLTEGERQLLRRRTAAGGVAAHYARPLPPLARSRQPEAQTSTS
jgi:WhiB family redox-sensing transcriptional regulator